MDDGDGKYKWQRDSHERIEHLPYGKARSLR
jgi:hypothetical protein